MSIIKNIKKRGLKDILNPWRWKMFLRSKQREFQGIKLEQKEILSYCEQVVYRTNLCKPCLKNGACTHCECAVPDLFYDKKMVCSGGNWVEMVSPEKWENYKKELGLEFRIVYK